jgi:hypothetical protein
LECTSGVFDTKIKQALKPSIIRARGITKKIKNQFSICDDGMENSDLETKTERRFHHF